MNTADMDMRAGARYAAAYTLRIILLYAIVAVICIVFLGRFSSSVDGGASDGLGDGSGFDYVPWVIRFALPILLVMPMAFMAGCYRPGDRRKLFWRIVVNVYMFAAIFVIAGDVSYTAGTVSLGSSGAWAEGMTLHVDTDLLLAVLMLVPIFSLIDAALEFKEKA